ncbi:MAG: hypothetical protein E6G65_00065 [Actinobacteria bacterium]|nr:MAG: hypothetical protein E6G65_00065 [Actinomycetota bacterium]
MPLETARSRPQLTKRLGMLAMSGFWLWWFLALLLWVAIAFWPARVASRKGHSFLLFFIFSLFFFPAAIIVAYMVQDRRVTI